MTAPTEREEEKDDRPLALMLLPGVIMIALALVPGKLLTPFLDQADARLMQPLQNASSSMPEPAVSLLSFAPIALTLVLFGLSLVRRRPTRWAARKFVALEFLPFRGLQFVHSGLVGDYVIWMVVGLASLSVFIGIAR